MSHYVHYVIGGGKRRDSVESGRELSALRHEIRPTLVMLEHRRRWRTLIVPFPLVAHATQLMQAFEDHVHDVHHDSDRNVEAADFRKRLREALQNGPNGRSCSVR